MERERSDMKKSGARKSGTKKKISLPRRTGSISPSWDLVKKVNYKKKKR